MCIEHNEKKNKKIFFEVISNSKIFNINFCQRNCQQPRFFQTYRGGLDKGGGTRQRGGGWTTSNTVYVFAIIYIPSLAPIELMFVNLKRGISNIDTSHVTN